MGSNNYRILNEVSLANVFVDKRTTPPKTQANYYIIVWKIYCVVNCLDTYMILIFKSNVARILFLPFIDLNVLNCCWQVLFTLSIVLFLHTFLFNWKHNPTVSMTIILSIILSITQEITRDTMPLPIAYAYFLIYHRSEL